MLLPAPGSPKPVRVREGNRGPLIEEDEVELKFGVTRY